MPGSAIDSRECANSLATLAGCKGAHGPHWTTPRGSARVWQASAQRVRSAARAQMERPARGDSPGVGLSKSARARGWGEPRDLRAPSGCLISIKKPGSGC